MRLLLLTVVLLTVLAGCAEATPTFRPIPIKDSPSIFSMGPTPTPDTSWRTSQLKKDPFTDIQPVVSRTSAIEDNLGLAPTLYVRCPTPDPEVSADVYIEWYKDISASTARVPFLTGRIRWDSEPAKAMTWIPSTSHTATFLDPLSGFEIRVYELFIENALESKTVYVRVSNQDGNNYDARFALEGLEEAMSKHAECEFDY